MEITSEKDPGSLAFPLPIYQSVRIGKAVSREGEIFLIFAGLSEYLVSALKKRSLDESDEEIREKTSDRWRFGLGSYEEWYAKNRVPFALVHEKSNALAALVWLGPKQMGRKSLSRLSLEERKQNESLLSAENWHTLSYRSYPPFRGKGLMKGFSRFAMDYYAAHYPGAKFWTGLDADNLPSMRLAEGLGFKISEEASDEAAHWLVMVKE